MRCISCAKLSLNIICSTCKNHLKPFLNKRIIDNQLIVYSFFSYNDICPYLHSKHHSYGKNIFKILASLSFVPFLQRINLLNISLIPIDDNVRSGYSHTAVLARVLEKKGFLVHYNSLRATNKVHYSGKSLSYRKSHPRNYTCTINNERNIVLIDDLVTSGKTLLEAQKACMKKKNDVLFALTLANAKEK